MKIHQLPMGAQFEFEGKVYTKTGPMFGSNEDGQRLFPKYAVLKPLGEHALPAAHSGSETLTRSTVLAAFDAFYAECASMMPVARVSRLQGARERFLKDIG